METCGNPVETCGNLWKPVETCGNPVETCGNLWKRVCGNQVFALSLDFAKAGSEYQALRTMLSAHQKTAKSALKEHEAKLKQAAAVVAVVPELSAPVLAAISSNPLTDKVSTDLALLGGEWPPVLAIGAPAIKQLAERLQASTYYKHQSTYLEKQLNTANSHTILSVTVTVRQVIRDITSTLEGVDVSLSALCTAPASAAKAGKNRFYGAFQYSIARYSTHEFIGITNICIDECIMGLTGKFSVVGVKLGKFDGDLKEQRTALRSLSGSSVAEHADFAFTFDASSSRNLGAVLYIPAGHLLAMYAAKGTTCLVWGCGCADVNSRTRTQNVMKDLFAAYPELRKGDYLAFEEFLMNPEA